MTFISLLKLYHISPTLQLGDTLTPDHDQIMVIVEPFVQALEQSTDCFYGMILNGKYLQAVFGKFGMWGWSNYAKAATEAAFEFIRKTEFPDSLSRMRCNFFLDDLHDCKLLYDYDWGQESQEVQEKVHLFEVEVEDEAPQRRDMCIYDEAFRAMVKTQNVPLVLNCARSYFRGEQTPYPVWEILSEKPAKAVTDISGYLRSGDI